MTHLAEHTYIRYFAPKEPGKVFLKLLGCGASIIVQVKTCHALACIILTLALLSLTRYTIIDSGNHISNKMNAVPRR